MRQTELERIFNSHRYQVKHMLSIVSSIYIVWRAVDKTRNMEHSGTCRNIPERIPRANENKFLKVGPPKKNNSQEINGRLLNILSIYQPSLDSKRQCKMKNRKMKITENESSIFSDYKETICLPVECFHERMKLCPVYQSAVVFAGRVRASSMQWVMESLIESVRL